MSDFSRYLIGIDLGTTNCCVAYVDTAENDKLSIKPFHIPQITDVGVVETKSMLPSFYYLAGEHELPKGGLSLPWRVGDDYCVGLFAREHGSKVATRLVRSAKSWLCNGAASRREKILPIECADNNIRISPVDATAAYLRHIKDSWNDTIAKGDHEQEFEQQEIILTVPASFDEVARRLTVEAAQQAGYGNLTLLEEPQAAFYHWIQRHARTWQKQMKAGDTILVCDIGGGTTDFSWIQVHGDGEELSFQRMAVGDHLLLGGDNMDVALSHYLENKLKEKGCPELQMDQWLYLQYQARAAKEKLLMAEDFARYSVVVQGVGSQVIGGSYNVDINAKEVRSILVNGFFGVYDLSTAQQVNKSAGIQTMGLPYEAEPSMTKHLACFLNKTQCSSPDYILFNGGSMHPKIFQDAVVTSLEGWFGKKTKVLSYSSLDLAVSQGAAYFGKVRRGLGVRIGGGIPRGYYLEVDVHEEGEIRGKKALTLLPRGVDEGTSYESDRFFKVKPNRPVSFQLLTSSVRLEDHSGDVVDIEEEQMVPLPPINTVLRFGKGKSNDEHMVPVSLGINLTEIGTLALWLESQETHHRWLLEFQLRSATGQDDRLAELKQRHVDETFEDKFLEQARSVIKDTFWGRRKADKLMPDLEGVLEKPRDEWPPSVLRSLFEVLLEQSDRLNKSAEYESRWWNLAGFLLRPGFGYPMDDFRVKTLWKIFLQPLNFPRVMECQNQRWICCRRVAGGLNKGQQSQLAATLLSEIMGKKGKTITAGGAKVSPAYEEKIRALGSLELVDNGIKERFGDALLKRVITDDATPGDYWALGRIGARHLIYGSLANVVSSDVCARWIDGVLKAKGKKRLRVLLGLLARKTGHREIDLSQDVIDKILEKFNTPRLKLLLTEATSLTQEEQDQFFGDHLPSGLVLDM